MLYAFDLEPQYGMKRRRTPAAAGERRILNLRELGIPDVPLVGRYEYHYAHPGLRTHTHPSAIEICYLARGKQTYRIGERQYHLVGGDLFVTVPGELHDTAGQPEDAGILYWINLRIPRRGGSLLGLPARDSVLLVEKLLDLPKRHFSGSVKLKMILDDVFEVYDRPDDPLKRVGMINLITRYLLEVVNCAQGCAHSRLSPGVARIAETIHSHPEENYSLAALAEGAGLSVSRFKARFKAEVGAPPHEYILRSKIEAARKLLQEDWSVTDIAMRLGFASSQYFATVFKRFSDQTPGDFRRAGPIVPLRPA
jgi:AraC-like DNA-binding protein